MSFEWVLIRGSGLVAFTLLAAATVWGLTLSTKVFGRAIKQKGLTYLHEALGLGALLATIVHMISLGIDSFIDFTLADLLVPGVGEWRPMATALGVMAFYALSVVAISFYVKRWIGQGAWRTIHYLGFGTFVAALLHGILAGTDRLHPAVLGLYVGSGSIVLALLVVRGLTAEDQSDMRGGARPARGRSTSATTGTTILTEAPPKD